ncbi:MAG: lamin tail domain-containing protein [Vicinamibacterales bacterium]
MRIRSILSLAALAAFVAGIQPAARLDAQASGGTVVISQIYGGGGNSGATYTNDFVELFNRGTVPVDLSTWSIQYASSTGTSWQRTNLTGVIQPGAYFLVQESQGSGGTTPLPTPDAVGTIAMSASSGKVALVANQSTIVSGTVCPSAGVGAVDVVGFGGSATCYETQPTSPNLNNTTAALRKAGGCTDTDDNFADFENGAPTPRNATSPVNACGAPTSLSVTGSTAPSSVAVGDDLLVLASVAPGSSPTSTGLQVIGNLSAVGGLVDQPFFDDGTHGDAVAGDLVYSIGLTVPAFIAPGVKSVTVDVTDAQFRGASDAFDITVTPPPVILLPHDVQGSGAASPLAGQVVTVEGVFTGARSNGVFIQTAPGSEDGDPLTSEGLFVFTSSAPAAYAPGTTLRATGTVSEYTPSGEPALLSLTELASVSSLVDLGPGATLPAPVALGAADLTPDGGLLPWERYEGMRVALDPIVTVSPTGGFVDENDAFGGTNGVFYAVFAGEDRPIREAGIQAPNAAPPCAAGPCAIPVFDGNPERIRVDSDALGAPALDLSSGTPIAGLVGIVDYGFRTWTVLPDPAAAPAVGAGIAPTSAPSAGPAEYTVASFNLQRFFDTVNDPSTSDVVMTPAALETRLSKASLAIRLALGAPDILGVQEVENLAVLQQIAERVNLDLGLPGEYAAYLEEGNDIGGIDVGFLVRTSRVQVQDVVQWGKAATFVDPTDGSVDILNDRPSLSLRATITAPAGHYDQDVIVLVNHLRSLNDVDDPSSGPRVRAKRQAQAEGVAQVLADLQATYPGVPVVSVGDYNAFEVNDGYVDVMGIVRGNQAPATEVVNHSASVVNPGMVSAALPGDYSYVFDGNAQSLDHILLSADAAAALALFAHARINADFPETARGDASTPTRLSDHDPAIAYFAFAADTTAPVLSGVPGDLAVPATDATGATVTFTPPTAVDDLDGDVAVTCEPASGTLFPVGDTVVTCTAADTAGNEAAATFTVTVEPPPATDVPGTMVGVGHVKEDATKTGFAFHVRETTRGWERGWLLLDVRNRPRHRDVYVSFTVTDVTFRDAPGYTPGRGPATGVDTVVFSGTGWWDGRSGYTFEVTATDQGERGRGRDTFAVTIRDGKGAVVFSADGPLTDGNIQSLRPRRR